MKLTKIIAAAAFVAFMGSNAMAQTTAPLATPPAKPAPLAATTTTKTTTAPAMTATTPATGTMAAKPKPVQTEVSKACSAQADAKGLHGKERKTFREACKKNGGKA